MIGIVLVTHGNLAREFIAALEHVVGPQPRVVAVCIGADDDMATRPLTVLAAIEMKDVGQPAKLCFMGHVLMENRNGLAVGRLVPVESINSWGAKIGTLPPYNTVSSRPETMW